MAKFYHWLIIICLLSISCQKQFEAPNESIIPIPVDTTRPVPIDTIMPGPIDTSLQVPKDSIYDIILLMGQSNTLGGQGLDFTFDYPHPRVEQLGRFDSFNYKVILAVEPLQNSTPQKGSIGFALTFAKLYVAQKLTKERQVLIIPCGAATTGFRTNSWNRRNDLYTDAVNRTNFILENYPGSKLKCFLWHQGESDVSFGAEVYQATLENMIKGLYIDIKAENVDSIPFIMGGFVPYWVNTNKRFSPIDSVLRNEPKRLSMTGFADPLKPFVISKRIDTVNAIHFDAKGQREMGKRYFAEYLRLTK